MSKQSIDSEFKTRINDLLLLNEVLVAKVDAFYENFDDNELKAVEVAYEQIVKLVLTKIGDALVIPKQIKEKTDSFRPIWLNDEEVSMLNNRLCEVISELKDLPKVCYTKQFDIEITLIRAFVYVNGETHEIEVLY